MNLYCFFLCALVYEKPYKIREKEKDEKKRKKVKNSVDICIG